MLRNLSIDLFVISYITGFFKFIPKYIIFLIILTYFFDAFALYFSSIGQSMIKNNANLNKGLVQFNPGSDDSQNNSNGESRWRNLGKFSMQFTGF